MVWSHLKILWQSTRDSERRTKERTTEEEMRRKHQAVERNSVWRFSEGSRRQEKMERYCCNVIYGARPTVKVKGLR